MDRETLIDRVNSGEVVEFLFFWGHRQKQRNRIDASCLSQFFPASFELDGVRYRSAEHWMMASKARVFGDEETLTSILEAEEPSEAKGLGRRVRNYDETVWASARFAYVVRGNLAKFSQNRPLGRFLLSTGDRLLVEASPLDAIWGIGLGASNPDASDPRAWRGQNLLGFALMEVRAQLHSALPA